MKHNRKWRLVRGIYAQRCWWICLIGRKLWRRRWRSRRGKWWFGWARLELEGDTWFFGWVISGLGFKDRRRVLSCRDRSLGVWLVHAELRVERDTIDVAMKIALLTAIIYIYTLNPPSTQFNFSLNSNFFFRHLNLGF